MVLFTISLKAFSGSVVIVHSHESKIVRRSCISRFVEFFKTYRHPSEKSDSIGKQVDSPI